MKRFKKKRWLIAFIVFCVMGCVAIMPTPNDTSEPVKVEKVQSLNGKYEGKIASLEKDVHSGKFTFDSGDTYDGKWSKKVIQGEGKYTYVGLGVYEGHFKKGKRSCKGTFSWNNQCKYVGQWKNDEINGKGEYTFDDGSRLNGTFKNNAFSTGKYTLTQNDVTYKYNIKKGELTNQIEIVYANQGNYRGTYKGTYKENKLTGTGTFIYSNSDQYFGGVEEGKKKGLGTYTWSSGAKYIGNWENDMMNGEGKYYYNNDTSYSLEGNFSNNVPNGECIYKKSSTEKYKTYWENGNCVKVEGYKDE